MQTASLDALEKAELPPAQARAILLAMELEWASQQHPLATKADMGELRLAMGAGIGELRLAMKTDMGNLRLEIEKVRGDLVRWVFTCILGQTVVLAGALYFILTYLRK